MVGSPFILINKNGRRTLLNTAQITAVSDIDILLTDVMHRIYWEYPAEQEIAYMVRVEQVDGFLNFMFTDAAERDELLDRLIAAISPSATIESAPGLPHTWPELARMEPAGRYILDGEEYASREEYEQARQERNHKKAMEAVMRQRQEAQSPTPPAPKPPRKPYTRKPRN